MTSVNAMDLYENLLKQTLVENGKHLENYNIKTFCFSPGGLQTEMGKQVSDVNYPRFIKPRELVSFVIHTIQYDENMMLDEIKINRTGI